MAKVSPQAHQEKQGKDGRKYAKDKQRPFKLVQRRRRSVGSTVGNAQIKNPISHIVGHGSENALCGANAVSSKVRPAARRGEDNNVALLLLFGHFVLCRIGLVSSSVQERLAFVFGRLLFLFGPCIKDPMPFFFFVFFVSH